MQTSSYLQMVVANGSLLVVSSHSVSLRTGGGHDVVAKKLTADLINQAIDIAEDFDEGIRIINDLAASWLQ